MNKHRRKEIEKVISQLETLKEKITELKDEEQEYIDNMPENLQESERYYSAERSADNLESAEESVDEAISNLNESMESN